MAVGAHARVATARAPTALRELDADQRGSADEQGDEHADRGPAAHASSLRRNASTGTSASAESNAQKPKARRNPRVTAS
jgi:hypothetical protein